MKPAASASPLPSVDRMLRHPALTALAGVHGRAFVARVVREELEARRSALAPRRGAAADEDAVAAAVAARAEALLAPALKPVFNLTGVVLHTNLGRAVLADEAVEAVARAMRAPANLEFDLASGERGERDALVESLLVELTGAEAATVVNNNASAVLLTIAALAARREVLVSRGELVEIGGAFRMPDVMKAAGARMVEVGTTNRTHARDFREALGPRSALVMKVHASNYVISGFTASVDEAELAGIAHGAGIPFAVDLGSGALADLSAWGLPREPLPQDALRAGADVVTFSGDKLLGGPQAGLIVGRREAIARIRRHPLKRALRVSKLTLAALEATLALYRHPESLAARLPTLRLIARRREDIAALAARVAPAVRAALGDAFEVDVVDTLGEIGSGSLPVATLPSAALAIAPATPAAKGGGRGAERGAARGAGRALLGLAAGLRRLPIPVVGRIAEGRLLLDLRCLEDEAAFVAQLPRLR